MRNKKPKYTLSTVHHSCIFDGKLLLVWSDQCVCRTILQEFDCATDEPGIEEREQERQHIEQFRTDFGEMRNGMSIMRIPVIFHVLHSGNNGRVSAARIRDQVQCYFDGSITSKDENPRHAYFTRGTAYPNIPIILLNPNADCVAHSLWGICCFYNVWLHLYSYKRRFFPDRCPQWWV